MGFNLNDFTTAFGGDRARAYQFEWLLPPPILTALTAIAGLLGLDLDIAKGLDIKYLVKSASFPESNLEQLTHYYQGAEYKAAGSRRYSDWTVSLNCNPSSSIRTAFELWMSMAHGQFEASAAGFDLGKQIYGSGEGDILSGDVGYYSPQIFTLLDQDGSPTTTITLMNSWPKSVGAISLDYSSQEIASFDVTFAYQSHLIIPNPL